MCDYRIFDSHAHYDDEKFENGAVPLLQRLHRDENVCLVMNAGASLSSVKASKEISEQLDFVYFSAGVHPENADTDAVSSDWTEIIRKYAACEKCRAIGEIGLDYYYGKETAEIQKNVFRAQMDLARELSLPVIVHDREAHSDCLDIISDYPEVIGVFHSYSGAFEMAKTLLKKGWYLSFNGIITFKNARKTVEVLEGLKAYEDGRYLERILVETDAPYLAPVPMRGRDNDSSYIKYTAERAAEILGMTVPEFCEMTYRNACRFYDLGDKI